MSNEAPGREMTREELLAMIHDLERQAYQASVDNAKLIGQITELKDIAQAQTNKTVREILEKVKSAIDLKSKEPTHLAINGISALRYGVNDFDVHEIIDTILNEYPDLLTNEEEKA